MRATGKTYCAVLRALADASEGKFVVFVSEYRHDQTPIHYAYGMTRCLHDCVFYNQPASEVTFREPDGTRSIGTLRFTNIEDFLYDVRSGRYSGIDRAKFKVVFDDCGPDEHTQEFLRARANG